MITILTCSSNWHWWYPRVRCSKVFCVWLYWLWLCSKVNIVTVRFVQRIRWSRFNYKTHGMLIASYSTFIIEKQSVTNYCLPKRQCSFQLLSYNQIYIAFANQISKERVESHAYHVKVRPTQYTWRVNIWFYQSLTFTVYLGINLFFSSNFQSDKSTCWYKYNHDN